MTKRILLIEPPFSRLFGETQSLDLYPLALGYLSGAIIDNSDWDVQTCNADFNPDLHEVARNIGDYSHESFYHYLDALKDLSLPIWQEVRKTIEEYNPDVVGISAKSQNYASARNVAALAKQVRPDIKVITGGPHASMARGAVLEGCAEIDFCAYGEGERTIVEFLEAFDEKRAYRDVRGLIFREGGKIIENPAREFIEDLDALSHPHKYAPRVLKEYGKYPARAFAGIFATRGCPYECFYCGSRNIWQRRVRFRSVDGVVEEIRLLRERGVLFVQFEDDTFGVRRQYIHDLCRALIDRCPWAKWSCEIHVKLVDEETIVLMRKAGCYLILMGIESGNNDMLRKIKKGITIEEALRAVKIIRSQHIVLKSFFMVGFPWDTEETLSDTIRAIEQCNYEVIYSIFTPYPGTEAFDVCRAEGLVDENFNVSLYNHQSPENCFCKNISKDRFREIVDKLESKIDRKSRLSRLRRIFDFMILGVFLLKIRERGMKQSLKKAYRVVMGQ